MNLFYKRIKRELLFSFSFFILLTSASVAQKPGKFSVTDLMPVLENAKTIHRIGFGSCSHQSQSQSILREVIKEEPDLFIYLGDNIYGDTEKVKVLNRKYQKWSRNKDFLLLCSQVPLLATWDDHDYGTNDAGKVHPIKEESKDIFLDFFGEPLGSPRRQRPGIYDAKILGPIGRRVQVILLDTRFFRDDIPKAYLPEHRHKYAPHSEAGPSILGQAQWEWLEAQLRKPAEFRIIASSIQFAVPYNGWEAWANFPAEKEKMTTLIHDTHANGVVFISGDVHLGELSQMNVSGGYPLFDLTSSGLNRTVGGLTMNKFRIGAVAQSQNYGILEFNWDLTDPVLSMLVKDWHGMVIVEKSIALSEISFPK